MAVHIKNMCHAAYFECMFRIEKNRRNLKNLRFFFQSSFLLFQIDFHAFNGVFWKIVLLPKRYLTPAIGMLSTSRMQMGKNVMMHPIVQIVFIFYLFFFNLYATYAIHVFSMSAIFASLLASGKIQKSFPVFMPSRSIKYPFL